MLNFIVVISHATLKLIDLSSKLIQYSCQTVGKEILLQGVKFLFHIIDAVMYNSASLIFSTFYYISYVLKYILRCS
jgi:hypothetical protein